MFKVNLFLILHGDTSSLSFIFLYQFNMFFFCVLGRELQDILHILIQYHLVKKMVLEIISLFFSSSNSSFVKIPIVSSMCLPLVLRFVKKIFMIIDARSNALLLFVTVLDNLNDIDFKINFGASLVGTNFDSWPYSYPSSYGFDYWWWRLKDICLIVGWCNMFNQFFINNVWWHML